MKPKDVQILGGGGNSRHSPAGVFINKGIKQKTAGLPENIRSMIEQLNRRYDNHESIYFEKVDPHHPDNFGSNVGRPGLLGLAIP